LTGASGFIGSKLIKNLIEKYGIEKIIALTSQPLTGIKYILHNNYYFDNNYLFNNGCEDVEIVIHAGAFIPKTTFDSNSHLLCNANIFSTEKILNSYLPKLKKILYLSSTDVYADVELINENAPTLPLSLYGYSKLYSEKQIEYYCKQKNIEYQILRIGHVYGPGEEKYQKIIPVCINKILHNETIQIYGDGTELRTYIYISDLVCAIIASLDYTNDAGIINIVGNASISIKELIGLIIKISKINPGIEYLPKNISGRNLIFDNSKMMKNLPITQTPLIDGIIEEYEYMKQLMFNL
jgi:nucleoside-diphosphate-sugar epimerase